MSDPALVNELRELRGEMKELRQTLFSHWESGEETAREVRARMTAIETRLSTIEGRLGKLENA